MEAITGIASTVGTPDPILIIPISMRIPRALGGVYLHRISVGRMAALVVKVIME